MGVQGLWKLLDGFGEVVQPQLLRGHRVAVDASVWMVQFRCVGRFSGSCAEGVLTGFFQRILRLLFYGIKPVFVIDGPSSRSKAAEHRRRRAARDVCRRRLLLRHARELIAAQRGSGSFVGAALEARCTMSPAAVGESSTPHVELGEGEQHCTMLPTMEDKGSAMGVGDDASDGEGGCCLYRR